MTMRSVAQAVGAPPMSLYRHFPSKGALLAGVRGCVLAEAAAIADRTGRKAPPGQRWRAHCEAYVRYWLGRPSEFALVLASPGATGVSEPGPDAFAPGELGRLLATGQPDLPAGDGQRLGELCRCALMGFVLLRLAGGAFGAPPAEAVLDALLDDLERRLAAPGAEPAAGQSAG